MSNAEIIPYCFFITQTDRPPVSFGSGGFLMKGGFEVGKSFKEMTTEERRECGRLGALRSAEVRREKKKMKDTLEILLSMPLKNGKCRDIEDIKNFADLKGKNIDVQTAIIIKQLQRALGGDLSSAEFIRDTSGQKPKEDLNVSGAIPIVISGEDELED